MVSTMREQGVFLLEPGRKEPDHPPSLGKQNSFILVVEDDAPTLRLQRVIMEEEGYRVEVVASGEAALDFLTDNSPSLVLLDIGLPGIDGFATCAKIRETSQVPIIMVTGRDCLDDKVKGMDGGADDYVTKPFLTHELATRVKTLLRRANVVSQEQQRVTAAGQPIPISDEPQRLDTSPLPIPPSDEPQRPDASPLPIPPSDEPQPLDASALPIPPSNEQPRFDSVNQETTASVQDSTALPLATSVLPGTVNQAPASANPTTTPEGANPVATSRSYEGTVRLAITTLGPVRNLINFVSELRQSTKFRLLRLVANQRTEGMDIWLGLRGPMPLVELLTAIPGVHAVVPGDIPDKETADQLLMVTLD